MSNIYTTRLTGSNRPVSTDLFPAGSDLATGDTIHCIAYLKHKTRYSYQRSHCISFAAGIITTFKLPDPSYSDNGTSYISNIYFSRYLPAGQ